MKNFFYRVKNQDTVLSLSQEFSVPVGIIIAENNLIKEISEGDILYICTPIGTPYTVMPTDTAKSIAKKFNLTEEELLLKNKSPYFFYGEIIYV